MRASVWLVAVVVWSWGCANENPQQQQPAPMLPPSVPGMMGQPMQPVPPTVPGPIGTDPPAMPMPGTVPMPGAQAGSGGTDPMPGTDPMVDPPEPADACTERRVSYTKPCGSDPNPCGIDSGFLGDEYCLLPPADGEGIQIHIGPDDYADPAEIAKYTIEAGEEFNNSALGHIPLEQDAFFDHIKVQMRPGSHHWISSVVAGKPEERIYNDTSCEGAMQVGSIGGGQNLIYDNPPMGIQAPENVGLGRPLTADTSLCMNLHAYNYTEEQQLRELWINIYFIPEAEVTQRAQPIGVVGGLALALPPGQDQTLMYEQAITAPGRIIQLFGHRHVWTPRFAVWHNDTLVYDSWSWQESVTYNYDSLTENPPIATEMKVDGAVSGVLEVAAGDTLTFSCFIENRSDVTLRFANELYTAEMCNLWGSAIGTSIRGTRF